MIVTMEPQVFIDWDNDGSWGTSGDDVTDYVRHVDTLSGITEQDRRVASVGTCNILLDNSDQRFAPENASGPYYGDLVPGKPVQVSLAVGMSTKILFTGYVVSWRPYPGRYAERLVELEVEDRMADFQRNTWISFPLQQDKSADELLKIVGASTYKTGAASGTITLGSNPSAGDSVTIDGITFTFRSGTVPTDGDVLLGTSLADTAVYLTRAINQAEGDGTAYNGTATRPRVGASALSGVVTLTANARGAWGNTITLTKSGAGITVSGATLTGGADGPTGTLSYQSGTQEFPYAGDQWRSGETNAMTIIEDITNSEYGYFWIGLDGTPCFKNKDWIFTLNYASVLSFGITGPSPAGYHFDNAQTGITNPRVDIADVRNQITVTFAPRRSLVSGTIGTAPSVITVPGQSGYDRWVGHAAYPGGGTTVVRVPFTDPDAGEFMGALSIVHPEAGTDYTVNDAADGSGFDYTGGGHITMSTAVNGSDVEITFRNTALGPLYVRGLTIRGVGLVSYDQAAITIDDATSQGNYGIAAHTIDLPLSPSPDLATSVASYEIVQQSSPRFIVDAVTFDMSRGLDLSNPSETSGLLATELGRIIEITESQSGMSNARFVVVGVGYQLDYQNGPITTTFYVLPVPDDDYMVLDSGMLDNARIGL